MSDHDAKWHWEQGNRYAVEGIKTLLLLNGGAALALLAFEGNKAKVEHAADQIATLVGNSMMSFGVGALAAALGFMVAYLTQLQYGNNKWKFASMLHSCAYGVLLISIFGFIAGLYFARRAILLQLN
jgi:hypothetical protein